MTIINTPVKHAPESLLPDWMLKERTRCLNPAIWKPSSNQKVLDSDDDDDKANDNAEQESADIIEEKGSIVYWMQRDMRVEDNWALLWAAAMATDQKVPLHVVCALPPPPEPTSPEEEEEKNGEDEYPLPPTWEEMPMTARHGKFLLGGLELVHAELHKHEIPFHVLQPRRHGDVGQTVTRAIVDEWQGRIVVSDFSPLRHARQWMELQAADWLERANVPLYQVDAHNIVPVWIAGEGKRQIGARTLRPRIHKRMDLYLQDFPALADVYAGPPQREMTLPAFDKKQYEEFLSMDESVPELDWATPGTKAGMKQFDSFVQKGLKTYADGRNDPTKGTSICSNLSPWTNYGHISFQRVTLKVKKLNKYADGSSSFIEEGVVRRELSDNYVYYAPNDYDKLEAALGWAQETLQVHSSDARPYLYSLKQLEEARTYDDLWNAAQLQVVREGQMHGFLRMYWAKKILEWTISPLFALRAAQYLNDKYALDGKDPNGFVGVGWSIMGIHDQGWKERDIFGKIRYMNYKGCQRKFDVARFVKMYPDAAENAAAASGQSTLLSSPPRAAKGRAATKKRPAAVSPAKSTSKSRLSKKLKS